MINLKSLSKIYYYNTKLILKFSLLSLNTYSENGCSFFTFITIEKEMQLKVMSKELRTFAKILLKKLHIVNE